MCTSDICIWVSCLCTTSFITIYILFCFVLLQGPPGKGTLISVGAPCSNEMKEMNIRNSNIYSEVLLQGAGNKESETESTGEIS